MYAIRSYYEISGKILMVSVTSTATKTYCLPASSVISAVGWNGVSATRLVLVLAGLKEPSYRNNFV